MDSSNLALSAWSYALAGAAYSAFALYLLRGGSWRQPGQHSARLLLAAVAASALWGWFGVADHFSTVTLFVRLGSLADLLRYACWFAFVLLLLRPPQDQAAAPASRGATSIERSCHIASRPLGTGVDARSRTGAVSIAAGRAAMSSPR